MTDSNEGVNENSVEQREIESRRNFLKASVAVGAAAAVLATSAHLVPTMSAAAKSMSSAGDEKNSDLMIDAKEQLVVSIKGEKMDVYQGEAKFPIDDPSFARKIASSVRSKI